MVFGSSQFFSVALPSLRLLAVEAKDLTIPALIGALILIGVLLVDRRFDRSMLRHRQRTGHDVSPALMPAGPRRGAGDAEDARLPAACSRWAISEL